MRSLRSSTKTMSSTPLSSFFWPRRHCWKSRLATSSRFSPSSDLNTAIAICVPVARSRSVRSVSRRARSAGLGRPAQSFSRAVGAGGKTRATARTTARSRLELHLGHGLRAALRLEECLGLIAREARHDRAWEQAQARVVFANRLVEIAALDRDAILCALELALQRQEVLVRLELGIALDRDQEPRERARELALSGLEFLERLRVVERLGRELDRRRAGPRARDLLEHRALLRREALDGLDEIRNQIGAALIHVLHLRPFLTDVLVEDDELVVDRDRPGADADDQDGNHDHSDEGARHGRVDYILAASPRGGRQGGPYGEPGAPARVSRQGSQHVRELGKQDPR